MSEPSATTERNGLGFGGGSHAPKSFAEAALLYCKGLLMGSCDIIPGVSGGTIALIVGVYGGLLESIGALTKGDFLRPLLRGRFREAFTAMHGGFLFLLAAGIGTAIVLLSRVVAYLLERHPGYLMAFFTGLVAASVIVVGRNVRRWNAPIALLLALGTAAGFVIVGLTPVETPSGPTFLFLSGFLAICAMVLPGISGAFILVLLEKYELALTALGNFDLAVIVPIVLGAAVGLLSFARFLTYLLRRFHDATLALLTGFMLGSLRKVWPYVDGAGAATWPWATGDAGAALLMSGLILAGLAIVIGVDKLARAASVSRTSFSSTRRFTPRR